MVRNLGSGPGGRRPPGSAMRTSRVQEKIGVAREVWESTSPGSAALRLLWHPTSATPEAPLKVESTLKSCTLQVGGRHYSVAFTPPSQFRKKRLHLGLPNLIWPRSGGP